MAPLPHGRSAAWPDGRGQRFGGKDQRGVYEERPHRTIEEGKEAFEERTGRPTSTGAISRARQKLGLTNKKRGTVASERETERVQERCARLQACQAPIPHLTTSPHPDPFLPCLSGSP